MYSLAVRNLLNPILERRSGIYWTNHYYSLVENKLLPKDNIHEIQMEKIKRLVAHAYQNSPFYTSRFDDAGVRVSDIKTPEDLKKIPPLTREDLNCHLDSLTARNIPREDLHVDSTGGSTGLATKFIRNNGCIGIKKASEYRFNNWTGWKPGEKVLYYWPALSDFARVEPLFSVWKKKYITRQLLLYSGRLNERILGEHLAIVESFRPHLMRVFPNSLQIFAEYLLKMHKSLEIPRGIICVGEPLNDYQRKIFEQAFSTSVFNCYVSRECGNIACECEFHNGLHIAEELLFLEISNKDDKGYGDILITDLENFGMPLIRYKIQDASRWVQGDCPCGRKLMRIDVSAARETDFLVSPDDGSLVSGATLIHYVLAEGPKIGRIQIVQDEKDHLLVRMAGEEERNNEEGIVHIRKMIETIFRGKMKVDLEFVDHIPFMPSGKYRFIDRKIPKEEFSG
jgi:phenylacetate-CoA ligase